MVSIETCQKRLDLMKTVFPCLKKPKCPRYILEVTLSALVQFTLPADLGKIKQSHAELAFLRFNFFCSFFCFSLISSLLVHFFYFSSCETQRKKHLKCKRLCKLLSCFYFPLENWCNGKLDVSSSATRARARINRLMCRRWPNGLVSFLMSTRKSQKIPFQSNGISISYTEVAMTKNGCRSTCETGLNGSQIFRQSENCLIF